MFRPIARFLRDTGYVINISELNTRPDEYEGLVLPELFDSVNRPWLVIPLFGLEELQGFMVLLNPLVERSINWEDHDLLKAAAKSNCQIMLCCTSGKPHHCWTWILPVL